MNRKRVILGAIGGAIATGAVVAAIVVPMQHMSKTSDKTNNDNIVDNGNNNNNNEDNDNGIHLGYKNMLTKSRVSYLLKNDWQSKTIISGEDLEPFDAIAYNAFDDIRTKIDTIEILCDVPIVDVAHGKDTNAIHWDNVSKIVIWDMPSTNNTNYVLNNVLFSRNGNNVTARTIADRTISSEITLPTYEELGYKYLTIASNFYSSNIFKNITKIKMNNTKLYSVCENAFLDCKILEQNLYLNVVDSISSSAFANTDITDLYITFREQPILAQNICNFAFMECHQLRNITITAEPYKDQEKCLYLKDQAFYNCENLTNVSIVCDKIWVSSGVFALSVNVSNNNDFSLAINTGNIISYPNVVYGKFNKMFNLSIMLNNEIQNYGKQTTIFQYFLGSNLVIGKCQIHYHSNLKLVQSEYDFDFNVAGSISPDKFCNGKITPLED